MNITVVPYAPSTTLDIELARLAYTCIQSWPDQRPVSASLVAARLQPHSPGTPTMLAVSRDDNGRLTAAAALRPGAGPGDRTRLWGPLVQPERQRQGLGTALLAALQPHVPAGVALTSAEVPAQRTAATAFFASADWHLLADAALFKKDLDTPLPLGPIPRGFTVRPARHLEDLSAPLEKLFAACRPHQGPEAAAGAFARWSGDRRYRINCLMLLEDRTGALRAAALAYPLAHADTDEQPEALLADLLVHPDLADRDAAAVRDALAARALNQARERGGIIGRAVVPEADTGTRACLRRLEFAATATLLYFAPATAVTHQGDRPRTGPVRPVADTAPEASPGSTAGGLMTASAERCTP